MAYSKTVNAALIALFGTLLGVIVGAVSGFIGGWLARRAAREADDRRHEHERQLQEERDEHERRLQEERIEREREAERLVVRGIARVLQEELGNAKAAIQSGLKFGRWPDADDLTISVNTQDRQLLASHVDDWTFPDWALRELKWAAAAERASSVNQERRITDSDGIRLDLIEIMIGDAIDDLKEVAQSEESRRLEERLRELQTKQAVEQAAKRLSQQQADG